MNRLAPSLVQARDIASLVHPKTNLAAHLELGPQVFTDGAGISITVDSGETFINAAAGLWCASLGYASQRPARVAYEQMRQMGYHGSTTAAVSASGKADMHGRFRSSPARLPARRIFPLLPQPPWR